VDDQPEIARTVRAVLVHDGLEVETAANGREALDLLMRGGHFDLVITDIRMPEMDGLELLRQVRQLRESLPVVVMTGRATLKNRSQAIAEGAFDYISKPFRVRPLLNVVHEALKGQAVSGVSGKTPGGGKVNEKI